MAASDQFKERFKVLFDLIDKIDRLDASEQETGRNFLAACKLFYDVSARLFRKVITEENRDGIPLPFRQDSRGKPMIKEPRLETIEELDFSYLGECLNCYESISKRSLFFKCLPLDVVQLKSRVQLKPTSMLAGVSKVVVRVHYQNFDTAQGSTLFYDSGDCFLGENVFGLIKKTLRANDAEISIYRLTDAYDAVYSIRGRRDIVVGHPSSTNLTNDALDDLFKKVLEEYKKLPWISEADYMESIEEIKTENKKKLIKAEDVKKELEKLLAAEGKLYMDWMNDEFTKAKEERGELREGLAEVTKRVDKTDKDVVDVKAGLAEVTDRVGDAEEGHAKEKEKREMVEQELAREKEKREKVEQELAREKEKREKVEQKLARGKEKVEKVEKELAREKDKREKVEQELGREKEKREKIEQELARGNEKVENLEQELAREKEERERMEQELARVNKRVEDLEQELYRVWEAMEAMEQDKTELTELGNRLENLEKAFIEHTIKDSGQLPESIRLQNETML